jgi:hypothetical protein
MHPCASVVGLPERLTVLFGGVVHRQRTVAVFSRAAATALRGHQALDPPLHVRAYCRCACCCLGNRAIDFSLQHRNRRVLHSSRACRALRPASLSRYGLAHMHVYASTLSVDIRICCVCSRIFCFAFREIGPLVRVGGGSRCAGVTVAQGTPQQRGTQAAHHCPGHTATGLVLVAERSGFSKEFFSYRKAPFLKQTKLNPSPWHQ